MQAGDHGHRNQGRLGDHAIETDGKTGGVQPGPAEAHRLVEHSFARAGVGVQGHQSQGAVEEGHRHHREVEVAAGAGASAGDEPRGPEQGQEGSCQWVQRHQPGRLEQEGGHGEGGLTARRSEPCRGSVWITTRGLRVCGL